MSENFIQALSLSFVGISTVYVALAIMALLVVVVNRLTQDAPASLPASAALLPEENLIGKIDRHKLVLLAAAASVAFKRPVRIRRVRFVAHKHIPSSWAAAGRADHVHETLG